MAKGRRCSGGLLLLLSRCVCGRNNEGRQASSARHVRGFISAHNERQVLHRLSGVCLAEGVGGGGGCSFVLCVVTVELSRLRCFLVHKE